MRPTIDEAISRVDTVWVLAAAVLVFLMQPGFLLLEMGFSRMKNAGTVVAKVIGNLSIAAICYWAVGFALAFGATKSPAPGHTAGWFSGNAGFFLSHLGHLAIPALSYSPAGPGSKFFFEYVFCAVSLAIVWGTTLERIKFGAYLIYAVVFSAFIYPVISHWIFGGGWLQINVGMQDFAGSTVVHLMGATGALAALLLLGPRQGKFGSDGKPNVIPGHSMPLVGLGVLLLFFGWFGFNPGSTLSSANDRFAEICIVTVLGGAAGVLGAMGTSWIMTRNYDIGMVGNGAIAGLVAITAPSGYVNFWSAPIIGGVAGVLVVVCVIAIDKVLDDPVGALSAHGVAGVWGTLSCGLFTAPGLAAYNSVGKGGLLYTGSFSQLAAQALGIISAFSAVFIVSFLVFFLIKALYGLRVRPEEERYGLDLVEHGMWGYPEQFMPVPGSEYHPPAPPARRPTPRPVPLGLSANRER